MSGRPAVRTARSSPRLHYKGTVNTERVDCAPWASRLPDTSPRWSIGCPPSCSRPQQCYSTPTTIMDLAVDKRLIPALGLFAACVHLTISSLVQKWEVRLPNTNKRSGPSCGK